MTEEVTKAQGAPDSPVKEERVSVMEETILAEDVTEAELAHGSPV